MSDFVQALGDLCQGWPAFMPPNRVPVNVGAQQLMISRPGGARVAWNPLETAYMVEPLDVLASRRHAAMCFVGPSQSGKTVALGEGWFTHCVTNDPGDMLIVQMTQDKAREYSKQRIDRALANSDALKAIVSGRSRDDNLHDKTFRNGMMLKIAWPTTTNLSSTSYRYVFGTDLDRWNDGRDNIGDEGDAWGMMGARVKTFLSRGMYAAESSPGREIYDPAWQPATPHEAPPVGNEDTGSGILGIYNRSDRRRLYWKCPHCGEWFQASPGLGLFGLPEESELIESIRTLDIDAMARQYARIPCVSGCVITPDKREAMNRAILQGRGGWLADGLTADSRDRVSGNARTSSIAGFWLGGVAATYTTWETLLRKYLQALFDYEMNNNEQPLKTTINTDQGMPYMSRHLAEAARAAKLADRTEPDLDRYLVPEGARWLGATVDVQGGTNAYFSVQIHAHGEHEEQWLVDRYNIRESKRPGMAEGEFAPIDPARYPEDWDVLIEKVVQATYRSVDPALEWRVHAGFIDSNGEDGVTQNAYTFARKLRKLGLYRLWRVIKGHNGKADWHMKETYVGGEQGRGDVPLLLLEPNKFKDMVSAGRKRMTPGPGYYHFPKPKGPNNPKGWLSAAFFDELDAETRGEDGRWVQTRKRNESFDHCYMQRALGMWLGVDRRGFWEHAPRWAQPLATNSGVISPETRREEKGAAAVSLPEDSDDRRPPRVSTEPRRRGRRVRFAVPQD